MATPENIYFSIIPIENAKKYRIVIQEKNEEIPLLFTYNLRTADTLKYIFFFTSEKEHSVYISNSGKYNEYIKKVIAYYESFEFLYYMQCTESFIRIGFSVGGDLIVRTNVKFDLTKFIEKYKNQPAKIEPGVFYFKRPFDFMESIESTQK